MQSVPHEPPSGFVGPLDACNEARGYRLAGHPVAVGGDPHIVVDDLHGAASWGTEAE